MLLLLWSSGHTPLALTVVFTSTLIFHTHIPHSFSTLIFSPSLLPSDATLALSCRRRSVLLTDRGTVTDLVEAARAWNGNVRTDVSLPNASVDHRRLTPLPLFRAACFARRRRVSLVGRGRSRSALPRPPWRHQARRDTRMRLYLRAALRRVFSAVAGVLRKPRGLQAEPRQCLCSVSSLTPHPPRFHSLPPRTHPTLTSFSPHISPLPPTDADAARWPTHNHTRRP